LPQSHVDGGVLEPHSRWRHHPVGAIVEVGHPVHHDTRWRLDGPPVVDGHMDQAVTRRVGQRGLVAQRSRPAGEDRHPGTLDPREIAGVGHEDARVGGHEFTAAYQPDDVVVTGAELTQLPSRDHAVLHTGEEVCEREGTTLPTSTWLSDPRAELHP
jgi:hypothetical protein